MKNTITRYGTFDAGHRVLHHAESLNKCKNVHGHLYQVHATFTYEEEEAIGYKVDFAEIKRVMFGFIDEYLDHGFIANPEDKSMITLLQEQKNKVYLMNLSVDCNPTAENIAKELFFIGECLMQRYGLTMSEIQLHETPNCSVRCVFLKAQERLSLENSSIRKTIEQFLERYQPQEYDQRKLPLQASSKMTIEAEEDSGEELSSGPRTIRRFINPKAEKTIP